jgi:hypothetical protein
MTNLEEIAQDISRLRMERNRAEARAAVLACALMDVLPLAESFLQTQPGKVIYAQRVEYARGLLNPREGDVQA